MSTLEKNKGVDLECVKCHMLKIENEKLKEEALKLTKFKKSTHCLNEMICNQKPSSDKLGLRFNSFEASSSGTNEIKFVKAQKKASSDGGPINMGGPLSMQAAPKAIMGPPLVVTPGSEKRQICDHNCRVTFSEHDSEITKDVKVIGRGWCNMDVHSMDFSLRDPTYTSRISFNLWITDLDGENRKEAACIYSVFLRIKLAMALLERLPDSLLILSTKEGPQNSASIFDVPTTT
ncbi:hypothetical protein Tco_0949004 [Tanacetum coccineum]